MKKLLTKVTSFLLAALMLGTTAQLTAIQVFANETTGTATTTAAAQKALTPGEAIEKEMAERAPITADRSHIAPASQAAVYWDGALYRQGDFSPMWNCAMEMASLPPFPEGDEPDIYFVLNQDMRYDSSWFKEKVMTIKGVTFGIDLNGHVLERKDGADRVIHVTDGAKLTIMDSNPTRINYGSRGEYGRWSAFVGKSTPIAGGVITGGYLKTQDGGGICIEGNSTVYMLGGTVAGNKADLGAGIYVGENCKLDMSRGTSQVCYNNTAGTSSDGGAVFLRPGAVLIGGYIHHNMADDYGGGIYAKGDNITIKDAVVYANTSDEFGGGVYLGHIENFLHGAHKQSISGCRIVGNTAKDMGGGGVYISDIVVTMTDCTIEGNVAYAGKHADNLQWVEGAGVRVSKDDPSALTLNGKIIIRNNHLSAPGRYLLSNLYFQGKKRFTVNYLSVGSEIWMKVKDAWENNGIDKPIVLKETNASHLYFHSDYAGYQFKYQNDPAQPNFRYLYLATGDRTEKDLQYISDLTPQLQSTPYTVETGAYAGTQMPLYRGYAEFDLMTSNEYNSASAFYYSDGYFLEDPTHYNKHLATMSINAAAAAFGRATNGVGDNHYANHFANIKQLFSDIGCPEANLYVNQDYQMKPAYYGADGRLSTIGVAITQKDITVNGETYTLVPIAVRGASYEVEWASNVSIGTTGEAKGFSDAAKQVFDHVQRYIENYGLAAQINKGKVKFWVVGYSRAGATANLTSKRLIDYYADKGNQIYGYTFEAPMGGISDAAVVADHTGDGKYPTIHNTINENDFVTLVAPAQMGFIRYGVDHLIGSDSRGGNPVSYKSDSKYYQQRMKMVSQMYAINPYYNFDDRFGPAEFSVVSGTLFGSGIIDNKIQFWDSPPAQCKNMYAYLRFFYDSLFYDGMTRYDTTESATLRQLYADKRPLAIIEGNVPSSINDYKLKEYNFGYSSMSIEQALVALMTMVMNSLTDEQIDALMTTLAHEGAAVADELSYELSHLNFDLFFLLLTKAIKLYNNLLPDWIYRSEAEKAVLIDELMHLLFNDHFSTGSIWDVLTDEQAKLFAEAVPVVLWFLFNVATWDYNKHYDGGMWIIPTFVSNMTNIITNHYQDVSVAWVRSYDDYYDNEKQAYAVDVAAIKAEAPTGIHTLSDRTLRLSAQPGASIYYSVGYGGTWQLYTKPVVWMEKQGYNIQAFAIYHGVKSEVVSIQSETWFGSLFSNGGIWFITAGVLIIAGASVVLAVKRKKRRLEGAPEEKDESEDEAE